MDYRSGQEDHSVEIEEPHTGQEPEKGAGEGSESGQPEPLLQDQLKQMVETGSVTTYNGRHVIHCLTIIGQIEGHYLLPPSNKTTKYEHVIPQLVAVEESPEIQGLLILLNTVGGDIEARAGLGGADCRDAKAHGFPGAGRRPFHRRSPGGIGEEVLYRSHRHHDGSSVRMNGLVLGVPQAFSYFERMQERITGFVTGNSHMKPERFTELCMNTDELVMDVGTVLDGESAVREGLIDSLGSLSDAIRALYEMIEA